MFDKKYRVKVYFEGTDVPQIEFFVTCCSVRMVAHNEIVCDGTTMRFNNNQYVVVEDYTS